jgi:DNA-binding NarL/FixJ family response regulator
MIPSKPVRVVLADDHQMVREALSRILETEESIRVVGQACDGEEALAVVDRERPDVLVLDYSMPGLAAPAVIDILEDRGLRQKVVILTVHENIHYAVRMLEKGVHGYVIKSSAVSELVEAIQAVHEGKVWVSPQVSQTVMHHLRRGRTSGTGIETLSPREFEVLTILGRGTGLKECARELGIGVSTASTYRARIMEKLDLGSTAEIIRFALENGLVG